MIVHDINSLAINIWWSMLIVHEIAYEWRYQNIALAYFDQERITYWIRRTNNCFKTPFLRNGSLLRQQMGQIGSVMMSRR